MFTLVGIAVAAVILALVFRFGRRRRRQQQQRERLFDEKELYATTGSGGGAYGAMGGHAGTGAGIRMNSSDTTKSAYAATGSGAGTEGGGGGPWDGTQNQMRGQSLFAMPASLSAGRRSDADYYMQQQGGLAVPDVGYHRGDATGGGGGIPRWSLSEFEDYYNPHPDSPLAAQGPSTGGGGLSAGYSSAAQTGITSGAAGIDNGGTQDSHHGYTYQYRDGQSQQDLLNPGSGSGSGSGDHGGQGSQQQHRDRSISPGAATAADPGFNQLEADDQTQVLEALAYADGTSNPNSAMMMDPAYQHHHHPLYTDVPMYGGAYPVRTSPYQQGNVSGRNSPEDARSSPSSGGIVRQHVLLPRTLSSGTHSDQSHAPAAIGGPGPQSRSRSGTFGGSGGGGSGGDPFVDASRSHSRNGAPSPSPSTSTANGLMVMGFGRRRSHSQQQQQQGPSQGQGASQTYAPSSYVPPPSRSPVVGMTPLAAPPPAARSPSNNSHGHSRSPSSQSHESHPSRHQHHRYPPTTSGGTRERATSGATQNSALSSSVHSSSGSSSSSPSSQSFAYSSSSHSHSHYTHSRSNSEQSQSVYSHQSQSPSAHQTPRFARATSPHTIPVPEIALRQPSPSHVLVVAQDGAYAYPDDPHQHQAAPSGNTAHIDDTVTLNDEADTLASPIRDGTLLDPNLETRRWREQDGTSSIISLSDAVDYSRRVT